MVRIFCLTGVLYYGNKDTALDGIKFDNQGQ